jgi:hypothetical protein
MRSYERAPDGAWRDALLMDILAPELIRGPLELGSTPQAVT